MGEQIKVWYHSSSGSPTKAYVDEETLEGTNKHTDQPVKLRYDSELGEYFEIENLRLRFDAQKDTWEQLPKIEDMVTTEELAVYRDQYRKQAQNAKSPRAKQRAETEARYYDHHIWLITHYQIVQRALNGELK